jgi:hypothetical protein
MVKFNKGAEATSPIQYPLDTKKIKFVSAGGSHTLFLTSNFVTENVTYIIRKWSW